MLARVSRRCVHRVPQQTGARSLRTSATVAQRAFHSGTRAAVSQPNPALALGPARGMRPMSTGAGLSDEVRDLLQKDIDSNDVFLFMKGSPIAPECGFSARVVQILNHVGATYGSRNVLERADVRNGIKVFSDWPTIPQVYVKGEFIGGCDAVQEMFVSGELQEALAKAGVIEAEAEAEK